MDQAESEQRLSELVSARWSAHVFPPEVVDGLIAQTGRKEVPLTIHVTLPADVQQVDETGYVWTLLEEADDPSRVGPGAVIVAGDAGGPFLARVVDIVESVGHKIVHLDIVGVPEQVIDELRHVNVLPA